MNSTKLIINSMNDITAVLSPLKNQIKSNRKSISRMIHFFSFIDDFRDKTKIKYKLENILCICLLISMRGEFTSFYNAAVFIKVKQQYFKKLKLIENNEIPSHDTLRRIFMYIDANNLRDIILKRINLLIEKTTNCVKNKKEYRLISGDGKTFNGSGRKDSKRNVNVFNILDASSAICMASIPLDDKESEITQFQRMLHYYQLQNTIVTADALHCHIETAKIIISKKGEYLFKVKDNNELLKKEIISRLERHKDKIIKVEYNQCDYEILFLWDSYLGCEYPNAKAFVKMNSHKRIKQKDYNPEDQFFITSSNNKDLILEAVDNRWEIEGDFHWFKDDFTREDECTFTDKNAIQVMATFNNITYAFYRLASAIFDDQVMAETRIRYKDCPEKMLYKLVPLLEKQNLSMLLKQNMRGLIKKQ